MADAGVDRDEVRRDIQRLLVTMRAAYGERDRLRDQYRDRQDEPFPPVYPVA